MHRCLPVAMLALIVLIAVFILFRESALQPQPVSSVESFAQRTRAIKSRNDNTASSRALVSAGNSRIHGSQLNSLKNRWISFRDENNGIITKEVNALAQETAEKLLCSEDALELYLFLKTEQMGIFANLVRNSLAKLLSSPESTAARVLLLDLAKNPANNVDGLIEDWIFAAGKGCSKEEFDPFRALLQGEEYSQEALFGRNVSRAAIEPLEAVKSTVDQLGSGVQSRNTEQVLKQIMSELPPNSDFEAIEQLLPADRSFRGEQGRSGLFQKWASVDPAAAVNYIIDEPERFRDNGRITSVVRAVTNNDPDVGVAWVLTFPAGPYFDEAAAAAIPVLAFWRPGKEKLLMDKIQNPTLRQKALRDIPN